MAIKVIWLGGNANQRIAAALADMGLIDDYEATAISTTLYINKPETTITIHQMAEAIERAGVKVSMEELRRMWPTFWANLQDAEIAELSENHVKLRAKEPRKVLSLRIPESLYDHLKDKAEAEGKTMTDIVIKALKAYLQQH